MGVPYSFRVKTGGEPRPSQNPLQAVLDVLPFPVFVKDEENRFLLINRSMGEQFGIAPGPIPERVTWLEEGFPPELRRTLEDLNRDAIQSGQFRELMDVEMPIHGELRRFHALRIPLRGPDGSVAGIVGLNIDITEWRKTEERALRASEEQERLQSQLYEVGKLLAVAQLAAGIAHEINNTLAIIAFSAEILLNRVSGGDFTVDADPALHLTRIRDTVLRTQTLVQSLQEFSRRDHDILARVDAGLLADEAIEKASRSAGMSGREMVLVHREPVGGPGEHRLEECARLPPAPGVTYVLRTSPQLLQRVLVNLLLHAAAASAPEAKIGMFLHRAKGGLVITVTDNGSGVPSVHAGGGMDPFFSARGEQDVTGTGLSNCRKIVHSLNGTLDVNSLPGKGTDVRIWLPMQPEALSQQLAV